MNINWHNMDNGDYEVFAGTTGDGWIAELEITFDEQQCDAVLIADNTGASLVVQNNEDGSTTEYHFDTDRPLAICSLINWDAAFDKEILDTLGWKVR